MSEDRADEIRRKAHALWENSGRPEGEDERFWHLSESDIAFHEEQLAPDRGGLASGPAATSGIASGL